MRHLAIIWLVVFLFALSMRSESDVFLLKHQKQKQSTTLHLYNQTRRKFVWTRTFPYVDLDYVAWSPDRQAFAVIVGKGAFIDVKILMWKAKQPLRFYVIPNYDNEFDGITGLYLSPDKKRVLIRVFNSIQADYGVGHLLGYVFARKKLYYGPMRVAKAKWKTGQQVQYRRYTGYKMGSKGHPVAIGEKRWRVWKVPH